MIKMIGKVDNKMVFKRLMKMHILMRRKTRLALYEIGQEHVTYIRDLMAEKKTGRIYIIKGVEHQASAPGEAPAIRSRKLERSLFYNVSGFRYLEYGADTKYAAFLEDGTENMDARPYLIRAALDKHRDTYNSFLKYGLEAIRS